MLHPGKSVPVGCVFFHHRDRLRQALPFEPIKSSSKRKQRHGANNGEILISTSLELSAMIFHLIR